MIYEKIEGGHVFTSSWSASTCYREVVKILERKNGSIYKTKCLDEYIHIKDLPKLGPEYTHTAISMTKLEKPQAILKLFTLPI